MEGFENLEDINLYDEAKILDEIFIPIEEAFDWIEKERLKQS